MRRQLCARNERLPPGRVLAGQALRQDVERSPFASAGSAAKGGGRRHSGGRGCVGHFACCQCSTGMRCRIAIRNAELIHSKKHPFHPRPCFLSPIPYDSSTGESGARKNRRVQPAHSTAPAARRSCLPCYHKLHTPRRPLTSTYPTTQSKRAHSAPRPLAVIPFDPPEWTSPLFESATHNLFRLALNTYPGAPTPAPDLLIPTAHKLQPPAIPLKMSSVNDHPSPLRANSPDPEPPPTQEVCVTRRHESAIY